METLLRSAFERFVQSSNEANTRELALLLNARIVEYANVYGINGLNAASHPITEDGSPVSPEAKRADVPHYFGVVVPADKRIHKF
jgi:hypothetical protein